jgi:hypothetical protein
VWFEDERDNSYLFEQAGKQASAQNFGRWFAAESKETSETGAVCAQNEAKTALHIAEEFLYLESEEFDHE